MPDDNLCPTCGHSLGFHHYDYGSCEAPLGGLTSKNMCGCAVTIHTYIQKLQEKDSAREFEQLRDSYKTSIEQVEKSYKNCMDDLIYTRGILTLASKKMEFLESKLIKVKELLAEPMPLVKWFELGYRHAAIKIVNIDEIISELEKDMIDG